MFKKSNYYWLVLLFYLVGWYVSLDFLGAGIYYYTVLTIISFFSTSLILKSLRGPLRQEIHLWVMFIILLVGYYLKFYILCYLRVYATGDYVESFNPLERELLGESWLIINYYEMVTIVFGVFALLTAVLTAGSNDSIKGPTAYKFTVSRISIKQSAVMGLLEFAIASAVVVTYLQLSLGVWYGAVALQDNPLPFRLAGIIAITSSAIIPLLFLIIVWLADTNRFPTLVKLSVGSYLIYGMTAGILSTSKGSLMTVLVSLFVLWLVTDTLTKRRKIFALSLILFMGPFNGFLILNRVLRGINPDSGVIEMALLAGRIFFSLDSEYSAFLEPSSTIANYLGLIMRINGADSLMNIIAFAPEFSLSRILHLVLDSPYSVSTLYAEDVLGLFNDVGTAFSPSLIGYFYFIFGNVAIVCLGMVAYTLVWHFLLRILLRLNLGIEPIAISMSIIALAKYTSEGTLESLLQSIILIIMVSFFGEYILRSFDANGSLRSSPANVKQS